MSSRRVLRAAQAIREVVSMAILTDMKDPRIKNVTVTFVEVSGDLRQAKVHVSIMGDESKQSLCLKGLQNSAGYLQKRVGNRIETKYTPKLQFVLDEGVKNSMLVTKILDQVLPRDEGHEQLDGEVAEGDTDDRPNANSPAPPMETSEGTSENDPEPMEK